MNTNKNILKILFFPLLILYYETILRIFLFDAVFNMGYIYMCLFSFPLGLFFYLLSKAFNEKTNKILFYVIVIFLTLYYCVQIIYYRIFNTFTSWYSILAGTGKVLWFKDIIISVLLDNIFELIIVFLPLVLLLIFHRNLQFNKIIKSNLLIRRDAVHLIPNPFPENFNVAIVMKSGNMKSDFFIPILNV